MKKRALALALCGLMAAFSLAGCSSFDGDETAMTVGDDTISADLANFASRYIQSEYETYYAAYFGDDMWNSEAAEGVTYEEYVKDNVKETLEVMLLCEQHQSEYDVELTESNKEVIQEAVNEFSESNALDAKQKVSGDTATVQRFMELMVIEGKVSAAIEGEVDTEVSDEEAAQKAMRYARFPKSTQDDDGNNVDLSEEELEELKASLENVVEQTRAGGDFEALVTEIGGNIQETTFDAESDIPDVSVVEAADALEKADDVTDVIETEGTYYVAQVTSLFDEEATEDKKDEIIDERRSEHLSEIVRGWEDDTEITFNDRVWNQIDFNKLHVTSYVDESDDYTDTIETDDVYEMEMATEDEEEE